MPAGIVYGILASHKFGVAAALEDVQSAFNRIRQNGPQVFSLAYHRHSEHFHKCPRERIDREGLILDDSYKNRLEHLLKQMSKRVANRGQDSNPWDLFHHPGDFGERIVTIDGFVLRNILAPHGRIATHVHTDPGRSM